MNDEGYSISQLTGLEHLYLVGGTDHFTDTVVEHILKLKKLKVLVINTNEVSIY